MKIMDKLKETFGQGTCPYCHESMPLGKLFKHTMLKECAIFPEEDRRKIRREVQRRESEKKKAQKQKKSQE